MALLGILDAAVLMNALLHLDIVTMRLIRLVDILNGCAVISMTMTTPGRPAGSSLRSLSRSSTHRDWSRPSS